MTKALHRNVCAVLKELHEATYGWGLVARQWKSRKFLTNNLDRLPADVAETLAFAVTAGTDHCEAIRARIEAQLEQLDKPLEIDFEVPF